MTKKTTPVTDNKPMAADGSITFNFSVPADSIAHGYQEVLQEYVATAEIKGFRKGKAPAELVEKSLDKAKVYSHVLEHVLPDAYARALDAFKYNPVVEPQITPISMEEGKDWEFKAETAGRPEITLGDYQKYISAALKKAPKTGEKDEAKQADAKLTIALDELLKNAKISISPVLIDEEAKSALSRLVSQLSSLKLTIDDYAKSIKKTKEEVIDEYKKTAVTNLKVEFLVSEIVKDLDPKVEDAELAALKPQKGQESYARYLVQKKKALDFISAL